MHPKLDALLSEDEFYAVLRRRIESGDLKITIGEENWTNSWGADPFGTISIPLALSIAYECPEANDFEIVYHQPTDFQHIHFNYLGDRYTIEWYKITTLTRHSDQCKIYFHRYYHLIPDWVYRERNGKQTTRS